MDVVTAGVSLSVVASTTAMINAVCVVAQHSGNSHLFHSPFTFVLPHGEIT